MKKLLASIATLAACSGLVLAGPVYVDKNPVIMPVDPGCQFLTGLTVDGFASGLIFNGDTRDDAIGGGVGFNYFFNENLGLGYNYAVHDTEGGKHVNALDLIYRMPWQLGNHCIAPYLMAGGGLFSNGTNDGAWRLGGGLEYLLNNGWSIFADGVYNWVEDHEDAVQTRLGLRFPF